MRLVDRMLFGANRSFTGISSTRFARGGAWPVFVLALASVACGGSSETERYSPGEDVGDVDSSAELIDWFSCDTLERYEFDTIEDFESGSADLSWYGGNDVCDEVKARTAELQIERSDAQKAEDFERVAEIDEELAELQEECRAVQSPSALEQDKPLDAELLPEPRCDGEEDEYALHVVAGPFSGWGGQVAWNFIGDTDVTLADFDHSDWEGISFWARRSAESEGLAIFVSLETKDTSSASQVESVFGEPALCDVNAELDTEKCDPHGVAIGLTEEWRFYAIPFSELRQQGWGKPVGDFDPSAIAGIKVGFEQAHALWDFWVDDFAWYRSVDE